jgi:hypothetical protein
VTVYNGYRKDIESIKFDRFLKIENKIFEYLHKIPDNIDYFEKFSVEFNTRLYDCKLSITFFDKKNKKEIKVDIIEDDEETIREIIKYTICFKKKINSYLTKGRIGSQDFIFSRVNKKRILIVREIAGKISPPLVNFTNIIVQKIK